MKIIYSIQGQVAGLTAMLALAALPAYSTTRSVPSQYSTVQAAINAASSGDTISIANGTYTGPFTVPSSKTKITIQGASNTGTILTAGENQVTLTVSATDVTINNIEIRNSYTGDNNTSQVLIITAARCAIRSSFLNGRQDTLYAKGASTSVYVTGSTIQGTVDFV
ncbi:MAG: pectinesterase family protein, partial [Verrucomicrobiota bacterium]